MTAPELETLMRDLKTWCAQERGRQAQLASELEPPVSRQLVNDWINLRKKPSLDQYFALKDFLKKQRRRR